MKKRCQPCRKRRKQRSGYIFSFTAGIFLATFFPNRAVMFVLSITLVLLALAYCRCP